MCAIVDVLLYIGSIKKAGNGVFVCEITNENIARGMQAVCFTSQCSGKAA
jgi:hypothetical protein